MTETTRVSILGATGSIGASAAAVILAGQGRFTVEAVAGGSNAEALAARARQLGARCAAIFDETAYPALKTALAGSGIVALAGESGVCEAAARPADRIVAAITGIAGLQSTCVAIRQGTIVALANKESLVSAGRTVMALARQCGAIILPLDSEHNSVFQALGGAPAETVEKIALTASGGPFRTWSKERIAVATRAEALRHPNFAMGDKITIDSATMMNKALELIEAVHLFGLREDQVEILVHPQQAIHGMVTFKDGSTNAGMATPDMRVPMAHCLGWPARVESGAARLDLAALGRLEFFAPDTDRFPSLTYARQALRRGGAACTVLNAVNEVAVESFLQGRIGFGDIFTVVNSAINSPGMEAFPEPESVNEAVSVDHISRIRAGEVLSRLIRRGTTVSVV